MRGDEPIPDIEQLLDLVLEHLAGEAQGIMVLRAEEHRLLQQVELLAGNGRAGGLVAPIRVPRDCRLRRHVCTSR
jgi:hypothetical protein